MLRRLFLLLAAFGLALAQEPNQAGPLPPIVRFQGKLNLDGRNGKANQLSVSVKDWSLPSGRTIERFPETGFVLVQLLAGQVTTSIAGQRQDRHTGDIWTIPAGTSMSITVKREMATLQTMAVQ